MSFFRQHSWNTRTRIPFLSGDFAIHRDRTSGSAPFQDERSFSYNSDTQQFDTETQDNGPTDDFKAEELEAATPPVTPGVSAVAKNALKTWPRTTFRPRQWQGRVYGLVVHTTGGSLPAKALEQNTSPLVFAQRYYTQTMGCHYINGWGGLQNGELIQVAGEVVQANGVGVSNRKNPHLDQRRSIQLGRFEADLPKILVQLWRLRWAGKANSLSLLPGTTTANSCYVHVECIPCVNTDGRNLMELVRPLREGLRFTQAQHEAVAHLAVDVARRNGWPLDQMWWRTPRGFSGTRI